MHSVLFYFWGGHLPLLSEIHVSFIFFLKTKICNALVLYDFKNVFSKWSWKTSLSEYSLHSNCCLFQIKWFEDMWFLHNGMDRKNQCFILFPLPLSQFSCFRCRRKFRPKRWLTRWSPLRLPRRLLLNNTLQFLRKVYFLFNGCRAYSKEKGFSLKICLLELSRRICVQMFTCSSQERPLGLKPSRAGYRRSWRTTSRMGSRSSLRVSSNY